MAYRPVPETPHTCVHCNALYYAKDKRRIYCTSSCNTLAWMARKPTQKTPKPLVKVQTSPSPQNVGVGAVEVGIALGANYLFNDLPAQNKIITKLDCMEQGIEFGLNQLVSAAQKQNDFINACVLARPELEPFMEQVRRQGELEEANRQHKIDRVAAIIAKKFGPK